MKKLFFLRKTSFFKSLTFHNFRELSTRLYISSYPLLVFQYCAAGAIGSHHKNKKNIKIVAVSGELLDYNLFIRRQGIEEAALPNMPSSKTT